MSIERRRGTRLTWYVGLSFPGSLSDAGGAEAQSFCFERFRPSRDPTCFDLCRPQSALKHFRADRPEVMTFVELLFIATAPRINQTKSSTPMKAFVPNL